MAVSCIVFLFAEIPSLIEIPKLADKTYIHTLAASKIKRLISQLIFQKKSLAHYSHDTFLFINLEFSVWIWYMTNGAAGSKNGG